MERRVPYGIAGQRIPAERLKLEEPQEAERLTPDETAVLTAAVQWRRYLEGYNDYPGPALYAALVEAETKLIEAIDQLLRASTKENYHGQ